MDNGHPAQNNGAGGGTSLLTDPNCLKADIDLIGRAVGEDWDIPVADRKVIVARLRQIVVKQMVRVPTVAGVMVESEAHADRHAVAAARVLAAMVTHNQRGRHHEDDNAVARSRSQSEKQPQVTTGMIVQQIILAVPKEERQNVLARLREMNFGEILGDPAVGRDA